MTFDFEAVTARIAEVRPALDRTINHDGLWTDYDLIEHLIVADLPAALDEIERLRGALLEWQFATDGYDDAELESLDPAFVDARVCGRAALEGRG